MEYKINELDLTPSRPNPLLSAVEAFARWISSIKERHAPFAVLNCMLYRAKGCPHIHGPICSYPTCYLLRDYLVPAEECTHEELVKEYGEPIEKPMSREEMWELVERRR